MSANVDKYAQYRPPIATYVLQADTVSRTFFIRGVPMGITGPAPGGAHTMLTNFISIQVDPETDDSPAQTVYISFGPSTVVADPGDTSTAWGPNPAPAPEGCIAVSPGETVRFDMSDLYQKGTGNAVVPIEYMAARTRSGIGILRIWRSSGR